MVHLTCQSPITNHLSQLRNLGQAGKVYHPRSHLIGLDESRTASPPALAPHQVVLSDKRGRCRRRRGCHRRRPFGRSPPTQEPALPSGHQRHRPSVHLPPCRLVLVSAVRRVSVQIPAASAAGNHGDRQNGSVHRRPDVNFTVIVNPNSGPGETPYPDARYDAAIRRLNSYPNVETVGYVRTGYATRKLGDVTRDVSVYSGWSSNASSLAMHGIFFDESPHQYSADAVDFMRAADSFVRQTPGLQGRRMVIHNPGVIPDARFNSSDVGVTVVFEETFARWQDQNTRLAALPKTRAAYSIMISAAPAMTNGTMSEFVSTLSDLAKYIFVTSLGEDMYKSFAGDWLDFVGQVPPT
ncbi:spherulin 4-like cell surface protein [Metarhizium album ARSEF 1941]|uniref:Spherulin 4-like cell surface protein n=1 Tax=Metarhizium album (strain ARSEF 1941) TaxID=1081103 RepID=A0A0B2WV91_METAS|nr:spherulin 4-like cell surface protein [Metarhizium album ARSEF 1941]KHN97554.1 spherulin 4-like cell surface protein [Metarhizium album ARSEF 1941]